VILVLAGTSEGRSAAVTLEREGHPVIAATATGYGGELLRTEFKGEISTRPLNLEEMIELITVRQVSRVIDATHPFAVEVSANAREACRRSGIVYERLEREVTNIEERTGVIYAADIEEAITIAATYEGVLFLTVGSSKLEEYTTALGTERLVVRILPVEASLKKCLDLGISPKNIIAMQGPFDEETNRLLFKRYHAALVISKESGPIGGTADKIRAARGLNIPIILIDRPVI
jgi:precorrin-6A/cobalt-precorrin-6A reductase